MAPKFNVPLDDPIYLFRTSEMMIHCNPAGGPLPTHEWFHKGVALDLKVDEEKDGYILYRNGTLKILKVKDTDAGEYRCLASNSYGTAESTGTAIVLG